MLSRERMDDKEKLRKGSTSNILLPAEVNVSKEVEVAVLQKPRKPLEKSVKYVCR